MGAMKTPSTSRRQPVAPGPGLQGEEYEIAKLERAAERERSRYAERLLEKAGHLSFPFLRQQFDS